MEQELVRANKCTAYWVGNGVAMGTFYRTHDKVGTIRSDASEVTENGFVFPESTDEVQVTAQEKLAAFKNFIMANATTFGIQYDPVDRRPGEYKFPSTYSDEDTFKTYSMQMAQNALEGVIGKVQNAINKMAEAGHMEAGSQLEYGVDDDPDITIDERYNNGNIKYAHAMYDIMFKLGDKMMQTCIKVELVSGQIKKPRNIDAGSSTPLTVTGIKKLLTDNGVLPEIKKEQHPVDNDGTEDVAEGVGAGDVADTDIPAMAEE